MTSSHDDIDAMLSIVASIVLDRTNSIETITFLNGAVATIPLTLPDDSSSTIIKSTFLPSRNLLTLETNRGDSVEAEIPTLQDPAPNNGRPVVYLDQKDWSLLANTLYDRASARSPDELDAAEKLISLARERKIILPMSIGHMGETAKWTDNERRYRLALTVAGLSRGWQMRHPLDVRKFELRQSLSTRFNLVTPQALDVFTLAPCAAEGKFFSEEISESDGELQVALRKSVRSLTCLTSYFDAILDSQSVQTNSASDWVRANQEFTDWLAKDRSSAPQKRKCILSHLRSDLEFELLPAVYESGVAATELETWRSAYFDQDLQRMPSLRIFSEIYQDKLLNYENVWRDNDLIDMMFLSCAIGYADFVVAERSLASYARQAARRLNIAPKIYPRISDLIIELAGTDLSL